MSKEFHILVSWQVINNISVNISEKNSPPLVFFTRYISSHMQIRQPDLWVDSSIGQSKLIWKKEYFHSDIHPLLRHERATFRESRC